MSGARSAAESTSAATEIRARPLCRYCGRRVKIRANGTATEHTTRGTRCGGGGLPVRLVASCGCAEPDVIGVFAYPPGRPRAEVSATVCARSDHQDAARAWAVEMAGTEDVGFAARPSAGAV